MDWTQFSLFFLGNIGFTLTLWLWNRSEANADRRDIMTVVKSIHDEVMSFHTKLSIQDIEFRMKIDSLREKK